MVDIADAAPAPGQAQPAPRGSVRETLAKTEIDLRLFGMLVALAVILARLPHRVRRHVPAAGEHGHARGPGIGHGDHGDRHGPDHRVAEYRPVRRVHRRRRGDGLRAAPDRLAAGPRARIGQPDPMDRRPRVGRRPRGIHRRFPGLHHRLHRRPVLHRHARRPAVPARLGLAAVERRRGVGAAQQLPPDRRAARPVRSAGS